MNYEYKYFNNKTFYVTEDTITLTSGTFMSNGQLWENSSIEEFYKHITDNNYNIVDIGAQSGLYTLYAKFLPTCNFYAFEPFPATFKLLNDNIELNNIKNVKTYNIALSDKDEDTVLYTSLSHNGLHTMGNNPLRFSDINRINIKSSTLDNIFFNNDIKVDFIKIDTEGWEFNIIKGGINTIKKYRPIIQLEWNETNMKQCNINSYEFQNFILNDLKYKVLSLINEELLIGPIEK
jgi:FkbM family methyltransferase